MSKASFCRFAGVVLAAALASIGPVRTASAADAEGRYAVKGFGQVRCERYSEARAKGETSYLIMAGWMEGYLTARNEAEPDTYDLVSFENTDQLAWLIDRHCRKNPTHRFSDVVRAMAVRLEDDRIVEYTDLVPFEIEGVQGAMYAETIMRMQRKLTELGLYAGPIEGVYSEATAEAVRAFQGSSGAKATGLPDQATMVRMFRLRDQPAQ